MIKSNLITKQRIIPIFKHFILPKLNKNTTIENIYNDFLVYYKEFYIDQCIHNVSKKIPISKAQFKNYFTSTVLPLFNIKEINGINYTKYIKRLACVNCKYMVVNRCSLNNKFTTYGSHCTNFENKMVK
jgi:hypothetical protein